MIKKNEAPNPAYICFFCSKQIMIYPQNVPDMIEQFARPDRGGKLALFFSKRGYFGWSIAPKMPTVLLHLPTILEATPRNRQKNFCLLRC
jgi:hypothetical protein